MQYVCYVLIPGYTPAEQVSTLPLGVLGEVVEALLERAMRGRLRLFDAMIKTL